MKLLIILAVISVIAFVAVRVRNARKAKTPPRNVAAAKPAVNANGQPLIRDGGMVPPLAPRVDDDRDDEKYWRRYYSGED